MPDAAALPTLPLRADVLLSNSIFEELSEGGISEEFLRHHCGAEDLADVECLELQVDATGGAQQVERLGALVPSLQELRLNQSSVPSLRDLGTGLSRLRVLWLCRSAVQDLGGISALPSLEELYLSFNDIKELYPLVTHESLQVLDLEGNLVEDFSEVQSLEAVTSLRELNLSLNPLWKGAGVSRDRVLQALPRLEVLDDIPRDRVADEQLLESTSNCLGSLRIDEQARSDEGAAAEPNEQDLVVESLKRAPRPTPSALTFRHAATARGADEGRQPGGPHLGRRELRTAWGSSSGSSSTSYRPATASSSSATSSLASSRGGGGEEPGAGSDLTLGDDGAPLVGNPLAAARRRRQNAAVGKEHPSASDLDIRSLLRIAQSASQGVGAALVEPCANPARLATPDVRIRTAGVAGLARHAPL
ncbi:unnamed protein product [Prorocentrum cordatum]|uniref:Leucine-rich repeat-containing protein 51 n=1 Tax=Prorocentrum cordatum TaxID=2364126 RepID=A0ABN9W2W1_9DINO|nr:unnamed protein product [Polarella glacialis]